MIPAWELWLNQANVEATAVLPSGDAISLISSPFVAHPPGVTPTGGLDAMLHQIVSKQVNLDGSVVGNHHRGWRRHLSHQPRVREWFDYPYNTETSAAEWRLKDGLSSIGMALTSALELIINGINATHGRVREHHQYEGRRVGRCGSPPVRCSGLPARWEERSLIVGTETVNEIAGVTVTIELAGILSVTNGVAHVVGAFAFTFGDEFFKLSTTSSCSKK